MRADAARNRGRLLEAAAAAFAEQGLDVPVAEIARRACVGPGTLFRHFPTKDDLIAAIIEERIQAMRAFADGEGWAGLERFIWRAAELHAADRGLMHAIKHRALENPMLTDCRMDLLSVVGGMIEQAKADGDLRDDFEAQDVPALVSAIAATGDQWRRYLQIVLDGLSTSAAAPASARPRSSGSSRATRAPSAPA